MPAHVAARFEALLAEHHGPVGKRAAPLDFFVRIRPEFDLTKRTTTSSQLNRRLRIDVEGLQTLSPKLVKGMRSVVHQYNLRRREAARRNENEPPVVEGIRLRYSNSQPNGFWIYDNPQALKRLVEAFNRQLLHPVIEGVEDKPK